MTITITLNGQRLSDAQGRALASIAAPEMSETLRQQGFTLKPVRAPKGRHNGDLVVRLCWEKRTDGVKVTMRATVTLQGPHA